MRQIVNVLVGATLLWLFAVTSCKSPRPKQTEASTEAQTASSDLTWTEAESRKSRLENVAYMVSVALNEKDTDFSARSEIQFDLKDARKPLRLDFFEGKISSLSINGKSVAVESAKKPYWIELPASSLREGRNLVAIDYAQAYSTQGQGLHRFVDPQSKDVFLYSQFETFDANRFMPCFDQPDLRSSMELSVEAPAKWQVISTTKEISVKMVKPGRKLWTFAKTLPLATYLFSLHAGPYKVWHDQYAVIPLRVMARPSMAKYVRVGEMFNLTKQGLKFFEGYFGFKYPFKKYDQIFVPEFNAGAMENVGAVTFSEHYLPRATPTRTQRRDLANTLLHEMAHMWFGDTVTMKWWNDLWLNESFASYMASLALAEATEFKEAWLEFLSDDKTWAYWEDSLITTHPIEAPVQSVKDAFATFDGITYGKGAAVIQQLNAHISPEAFQKGIKNYFSTFAMKNAELKDFIGALQKETKSDLSTWAERWLRQSGTDKIEAEWTCEGKRLHAVTLTVTPSPLAQFRPQTVNIALFDSLESKPVVLRADLNQATQKFSGDWACPVFVYPNFGDAGYASVQLDPVSLAFAKKNLSLGSIAQLEMIADFTAAEKRSWVRLLALDDAADFIQNLEADQRHEYLMLLDEVSRQEVMGLLAYAEDEAGGVMNPRYIRLRPDMSVEEAIRYLRAQARTPIETIYYTYVLDYAETLLGVVSFRELLLAAPDKRVREIMKTDLVTVPEEMDREALSEVFSSHQFMALPVVDENGHMKGIVTYDDIVDVVQKEATEDIQKLGGMEALDAPYFNTSFLEMMKKRVGWLTVLFIGEMFTATAMAQYEDAIAKAVVLSLFIPLIISSGGNSGSQASTLIIRSLALREIRLRDWLRVFGRELAAGLVLGTVLGGIGLIRVYAWHLWSPAYGEHYMLVGLTVALSVLGVVMWGTLTGAMLPFLLRKAGLDPASASAPMVATVVDVTGLVIYFTTASIILNGTLL